MNSIRLIKAGTPRTERIVAQTRAAYQRQVIESINHQRAEKQAREQQTHRVGLMWLQGKGQNVIR